MLFKTKMQDEAIPSSKENPKQWLRKWYDPSLNRGNVSMDHDGLPCKFKAWLF